MCRYGDPFMEGTYICTFLYIGKFEECTAIPEDDNVSGIRTCAKIQTAAARECVEISDRNLARINSQIL